MTAGANALVQCVWTITGSYHWMHVLLMDGNTRTGSRCWQIYTNRQQRVASAGNSTCHTRFAC